VVPFLTLLVPFLRTQNEQVLTFYIKEWCHQVDWKGKINIRRFKYMEFWGIGMCKDEPYVQKLGPYLDYWENILELLWKPLSTQNSTLLEGFWPSSNWRSNHMWSAIPSTSGCPWPSATVKSPGFIKPDGHFIHPLHRDRQ
jgi:hypothetical protein